MHHVPPSREPAILAVSLGVGVAIGALPLDEWASRLGGHPALGTMVAVNVLLPLATATLAVAFPRLRTAAAGGVLVVAGFALARLLQFEARIWTWTPQLLASRIHPILVAAAVACAAIGAIVAGIVRTWRRVGVPSHHPSCRTCGHALSASPAAILPCACPECGTPVRTPSDSST